MNLYKNEEEYDLALKDASKILELEPDFQAPKFKNVTIPELERL